MHRKLIVITAVLLAVAVGCSSSPSGDAKQSTSSTRGFGGRQRPRICSVAKPADLTAAGIEGKITLTDDFANFTMSGGGNDPTTCEFIVDDTSPRHTNVVVTTDNGGAEQYQFIVSHDFGDTDHWATTPLERLGDQGVLAATKPRQRSTDSNLIMREILVRKGQIVLNITVVGDVITTESLEKLARIIAPRLP